MKRFIRTLSVLLAVLMAALTPLQVFAEANDTKYVSEIVTVEAGSFNEAKTALEAAGYKAVDGNLNGTLGVGIYLGYKETADKKEAITDIAAMNMLGKFSYSDYKQIMESYKENIEAEVENIETSIEEFQNGYNNEKKNALMAYDALNLFRDDDSGSLMGDYFLDYDFSDASHKSVTDTLMQANSDIVVSMIRALTFAGDADDTTLIDRMVKTGPDGVRQRYANTYQTTAQAESAMAKDFGKIADVLYDEWDEFYKYLRDAEENLIVKDKNGNIDAKENAFEAGEREKADTEGLSEEDKEFVEGFNAMTDVPEIVENTSDVALYALLSVSLFGDGTMLDFFNRPKEDIDKSELYVLVDSMSDVQKSQIAYTSIKELLLGAFSADEESTDGTFEAVDEYASLTEGIEPVSIFEGIDRSVFEEGVAFTSDAVTHESLSSESWLDKLGGIAGGDLSYWTATTITCWTATCALAATGVIAMNIKNAALKKLPALEEAKDAAKSIYNEKFDWYKRRWRKLTNEEIMDKVRLHEAKYVDDYEKCLKEYNDAVNTIKIGRIVKGVSFLLLVVAVVVDIYTIIDYFVSDSPVEEKIPHHMMATAMTAYGEDYVYYQTVKTVDGEAADVNAHKADPKTGWLVLYTTKDANAGDAICAGNINVHIGDTDFGDASAAHLFNEEAALNTTAAIYTGVDDTVGGTYILFDRSDSALTGSAISGGIAALTAAGGLVLGGALGSIITALAKKKKKAEA